MRRKLFTLAAGASAVLCAAFVLLWADSYRPRDVALPGNLPSPTEVPRGGWRLLNRRGQMVVLHHKASPEPHGSIGGLRGTWGTTTTFVGTRDDGGPVALVKALVLDPAAPWDGAGRPTVVLSRPYILVPLAEGCRLRNGGGFAGRIVYVPDPDTQPEYAAVWKSIGWVLQFVTVPHWFAVLATAVPPARWLWRRRRARLREAAGLCPACGYDLRATPDRCLECGTAVGGAGAAAEPGPAEPVAPDSTARLSSPKSELVVPRPRAR